MASDPVQFKPNPLQPLNWKVPIVNKDGTPTQEFMMKWQQQFEANKSIPDLSTVSVLAGDGLTGGGPLSDTVTLTADVQAILDLLSTTKGVIIYRGADDWFVLAPGADNQLLSIVSQVPEWVAPPSTTPALTHNHVFVGTSGNVAGDVAMSGDATIADTGALTLKNSGATAGTYGDSTHVPVIVVDAQGRITGVTLATISGGGGGGYPAGTPPTVVQVAHAVSATAATFATAPTAGNLLVAFTFNSNSNTTQSGWTKQIENSSGTDWGNICTKTAGASEPTTQQAMPTTSNGGVVIYELHKGSGTPVFVSGASQGESSQNSIIAVTSPNVKDCIGISACGLVGTSITYSTVLNVGTQDVLDNTGNRRMLAGHSDLSTLPICGVMALLSGVGSTKCCTALFT